MYILVAGGGKVGLNLSRSLLQEGHEVLCIEKDATRCAELAEELGGSVIRGDSTEVALLAEAGASRADSLLAVTGEDPDNLIACQIAKHHFNVQRTVARINDPTNRAIFRLLGVDATVSATDVILTQIEQEMPTHPLIPLLTLRGQGLEVVDIQIPEDSNVVGKQLRDIPLPSEATIALIVPREGAPYIPNPNTIMRADDEVVAVTQTEMEEQLRGVLTNP